MFYKHTIIQRYTNFLNVGLFWGEKLDDGLFL